MTTRTIPIDPPADVDLWCRNCHDPIVATGEIRDSGPTIRGLRAYQWTHAHGSDTCQPKTVAQPFDGWEATRRIEAEIERRYDPEAVL